ncbi:MAG: insulinase family protein [Pseudomonadales bacterium]
MTRTLATLTLALTFTVSAALLGACAGTTGPQTGTSKSVPPEPAVAPAGAATAAAAAPVTIRQSPNDDRQYRYLTLDNGLRVLLVSDPTTDKAAASLVVERGSFHEPEAYPGLAHFLEHMLFIGTEKYPEVDAYQQFIAKHGGASNAYTAGDHTNYFFDIQPDYFAPALDRFAQFFISPLLDSAYVEREKNAVNSEYQMQIKDDAWRGNAAVAVAMNPAHPEHRFNIGSLETLGEGVEPALHRFLDSEYSADQMVLVALSSEPLDTLERTVKPLFGAIKNRHLGPAPITTPLFLPESLPAVLRYRTTKDGYKVSYNFPIPATRPYYATKPAQYISNLLGHEGKGSLYQSLKRQGWIEALSAGETDLDDSNGLIVLSLDLTDAGYRNLERVNALVFAYIDLVKRAEPEAWRYHEQAVVADLGFRFQEKTSATGFVYQVAPRLAEYPPQDVLVAPYLMTDFDPDLIKDYLYYLQIDNVLVEIAGPDVQTDQRERWFDVPYSLEQRRPRTAPVAVADLQLPEPNPYLPEDLSLLADDPEPPARTVRADGLALWTDRDTSFGVPKADVFLSIGVRDGLESARDQALAQLYRRLVDDALSETVYPAYLAGLGYTLDVDGYGFELNVGGYSDGQLNLLRTVLEGFTGLTIDPQRFAALKAELLRELGNYREERPYSQTYGALGYLLLSSRWPPEALISALEDVTVADLNSWRSTRLGAFNVVGLQHGNVDAADAAQLVDVLDTTLPLAAVARLQPQVHELDARVRYDIPIDHDDASMVLYVQDPDSSYASRAASALATQLLRQAYFTSLRTEQQLGYVVTITNPTLRDRSGLAFVVQSPVASAARLESLTLGFLEQERPALEDMSEADFERYKQGLVVLLTEQDKNLTERGQRYWSDLLLGVTTFDSNARIANAVAALDKQDMLAFLDRFDERLERARLIVYNRGKFAEVPEDGTLLTDVIAFKGVPSAMEYRGSESSSARP